MAPEYTKNTDSRSKFLLEHFNAESFSVGVICGSGIAAALEHMSLTNSISMKKLGLPVPKVVGHDPRILCWEVAGTKVLVLGGRVHAYEGYSGQELGEGVALLHEVGVKTLITTNAAGSINPPYITEGNFVLIKDHIDLTGVDPLEGFSFAEDAGSRFTDMNDAYSERLRSAVLRTFPTLSEGVYAARRGPSYETPAEINALRKLGADLAGMSTTWEVVLARHLKMEVLGISLVTNLAAGLATTLSHKEVMDVGSNKAKDFAKFIKTIVEVINENEIDGS